MAGRRTDEVVHHWRDAYNLQYVPNDELENTVVSNVIASIQINDRELPGVRKIIALLESHNIPMAVASSSSPEIIDAVLSKLSLKSHMKVAYSAKAEKLGKPHPGVFLTTAKKLGVRASYCLVFEDALSGIKAAKAAGMKCIAIPEKLNLSKPEFSEADIILPSLELVDWNVLCELFGSKA